jgi:myo-inositol-1(or 4)-monophosphatase
VHGIPIYSISIALQKKRETIIGVVHELNQNECFYAWEGGKAYLNGNPIKVSSTEKLDNSLIATGFPYNDFSRMKEYLGLFNELMQNTRGIRRLGSAAADLAYVACGRFEVFYEYGLHPWDVAAGAFIVKQAGGKLNGFDGSNEVVFGKDIMASNGLVHLEMLQLIKKHFELK